MLRPFRRTLRSRLGLAGLVALACVGVSAAAGCARDVEESASASDSINAGSTLVISQVYGAGGNAGGDAGAALFSHDYVELFNRGQKPVALEGKAILYAPESGAFSRQNAMVLPAMEVPPGGYVLVQLGTPPRDGGTLFGSALAPDITGAGDEALLLSATSGTVALAGSLEGCKADQDGGREMCNDVPFLDFVGYGGAKKFDGAKAAPAPSTLKALFRGEGGCADTNENRADFTTDAPAPRNAKSDKHLCREDADAGAGEGGTNNGGGAADAGGGNSGGGNADAGNGGGGNNGGGGTADAGNGGGGNGGGGNGGGGTADAGSGGGTSTGGTHTGTPGAPGAPGKDGKDGKDGLDGEDGANGADGTNGKNGKDGEPGAMGKTGPAGPEGPGGCSTSPSGGTSSPVSALAGLGLVLAATRRRKKSA